MNKVEGVNFWSDWKGKCPDCGSEEFLQGPSGGLSINMQCAKCNHWFNHMGFFGIERIHWEVPAGCLAVGSEIEMTIIEGLKLFVNKLKERFDEGAR